MLQQHPALMPVKAEDADVEMENAMRHILTNATADDRLGYAAQAVVDEQAAIDAGETRDQRQGELVKPAELQLAQSSPTADSTDAGAGQRVKKRPVSGSTIKGDVVKLSDCESRQI